MLEKQKQRLKELQAKEASFTWDIMEIRNSKMDPDYKAMWLNDAEYSRYMVQLEIEELEHYIAMFPLKLMLGGFVIFVLAMTIYMTS